MVTEVPDQIDRPVRVGDWIAYGVGRGEISTALVIGFVQKPGLVWDDANARWKDGIVIRIQIKSAVNDRASLIEARRKEFVKIEAREEGAEMRPRRGY